MKSLARVIPTVVAHELKDMGELVDIDSHQVKEEIVAVVDEVRSVGYGAARCSAVRVSSLSLSLSLSLDNRSRSTTFGGSSASARER